METLIATGTFSGAGGSEKNDLEGSALAPNISVIDNGGNPALNSGSNCGGVDIPIITQDGADDLTASLAPINTSSDDKCFDFHDHIPTSASPTRSKLVASSPSRPRASTLGAPLPNTRLYDMLKFNSTFVENCEFTGP